MLQVTQLVGFGSGGGSDISGWDPNNKNANVTLSGIFNVTASAGGVPIAPCLGVVGHASGRWYAEITIENLGQTNTCEVGVGNSTMSLADSAYPGSTNDGWGYYDMANGSGAAFLHNNSLSGSSIPGFTTGSVIQIALDLDAGKLWFGKDGTFNGSPSGGTGAAFSSGLTGTALYLACASRGGVISVKTGRDFTYSIPTGFTAWGG